MGYSEILRQQISIAHGSEAANSFFEHPLREFDSVRRAVTELMAIMPPMVGACAMMSATLGAHLQDEYNIPAVIVVGDLKIQGKKIFDYKKPIPFDSDGTPNLKKWSGHCWVGIDEWIIDVSIFRTAYLLGAQSVLGRFVVENFGEKRGALLASHGELASKEMEYIPRAVLRGRQINNLVSGFGYMVEKNLKNSE